MPPTLHLPGSGKTTLARRLEGNTRRLTPDEWMVPLFGVGDVGRKRDVLERRLLWGVAARALTLGVNVVLDFGFWPRTEREDDRARREALGAQVVWSVLNVPVDELWRRLETRDRALPPNTLSRHPGRTGRVAGLVRGAHSRRDGPRRMAHPGTRCLPP